MRVVMLSLLAIAAACGDLDFDEDLDIACPGDATQQVTIEIVGTPMFEIGSESVVVRGTAEHMAGLTVRRVIVEGVDATADSFNFSAWSATIPAVLIESLTEADPPTSVMLRVRAFDPCDGSMPAGVAAVTVDVVEPPP